MGWGSMLAIVPLQGIPDRLLKAIRQVANSYRNKRQRVKRRLTIGLNPSVFCSSVGRESTTDPGGGGMSDEPE